MEFFPKPCPEVFCITSGFAGRDSPEQPSDTLHAAHLNDNNLALTWKPLKQWLAYQKQDKLIVIWSDSIQRVKMNKEYF